jgi:peptidyl-tRNA hydrolase
MYIFLNAGAGMSTGKAAAQAAHAAVEAYRLSCPPAPDRPEQMGYFVQSGIVNRWYQGGHYKKIVLRADDEQHLHTIQRYLEDRGFKTKLIVDEGMTEVRPHTATALGVEVVNKDDGHTAATFSTFDLFRDPQGAEESAEHAPLSDAEARIAIQDADAWSLPYYLGRPR